ncbi:uncharacterized protein LOC116348390 [Contarinia nasturtii]|uniref:uncharacterized protein LOC116348390 n=1 Tax=Contarinia nasturtii TaxID=265458 RepID=UPI0012D4935E|nr:uncharacterized protein LOC116348390 [Contarinia nasturtii]
MTILEPEVFQNKNVELIEAIKTFGRNYIQTIESDFKPTMEHNIATALYIRMKKLTKMDAATREKTYDKINELISNTAVEPIAKVQKKKRTSNNLFDSFADSDDDGANHSGGLMNADKYCQELQDYLQMKLPDSEIDDNNDTAFITQWWFKHRTIFPNLFKLFMRISAIPASSAPSERCFSVTGQVISERRSCILPQNVENIIMCRNIYE